MAYRIVPTPGIINPSAATLVRRVYFVDPDAAPGTFKTTTGCTYALHDEAGTAIVAATAATPGSSTLYSASMPAALDVGKLYRETWTPTISGEVTRPITVPVFALGFDYEDCPVSTVDLLSVHPTLTTYPGSAVSWETQIEAAWIRTLTRLGRTSIIRRAMWDVTQLYEVTVYEALAIIFRQAATFTGGPAIEMAREYERLSRDEWESLRIRYDSDGDGDLDGQTQAETRAYPPGAAVVR